MSQSPHNLLGTKTTPPTSNLVSFSWWRGSWWTWWWWERRQNPFGPIPTHPLKVCSTYVLIFETVTKALNWTTLGLFFFQIPYFSSSLFPGMTWPPWWLLFVSPSIPNEDREFVFNLNFLSKFGKLATFTVAASLPHFGTFWRIVSLLSRQNWSSYLILTLTTIGDDRLGEVLFIGTGWDLGSWYVWLKACAPICSVSSH